MKTKIDFPHLIMAVTIITLLTSFGISTLKTVSPGSKIKIGIFDSRAVAYAYANSDMYKVEHQKTSKENTAMLESKDTAKWHEAMFNVCSENLLLHQRVFATGSAASILRKVETHLPALAKNAGVDIIVSKWELTWLDPNATLVDLTDSIAQLFIPLERLDQVYGQIKNADRMEVEQIGVGETIEIWQQFEKKYLGK